MIGQYLLPTDDEFIEQVAKSIARTRWEREGSDFLKSELGEMFNHVPKADLQASLDTVFERLWSGKSEEDERQRSGYRADARAAISTINLKLLTLE